MAAYSTLSDLELAALLRRGDKDAFTQIYSRFFGLLYVHAYRMLHDPDDASDVTQEVFANIWEKREALVLTGSLSSYLYAAVRNRMLDNFEHSKVAEKYKQAIANFAAVNQECADYRIRERQLIQLIEKEIGALPEPMQQIFILSRKENLSHKEIASELGLSEQAVKSQVKRALRILKTRLGFFTYLMVYFKLF